MESIPIFYLKTAIAFSSFLFLFCSFRVVWKTLGWGWFLSLLLIYAYFLHPYITALLYWKIHASPFWFSYPYFVGKNPAFFNAFAIHSLFCAGYAFLIDAGLQKLGPLVVKNRSPLPTPNGHLLALTGGALLLFIFSWKPWLSDAFRRCVSLYGLYKRGELVLGNYYVITRLLFDFCALSSCYLVAVPLANFFKSRKLTLSAGVFWCFSLFFLGVVFFLASILGDKQSLTLGILFVSTLLFHSKKGVVLGILSVGAMAISLNWITVIRSDSLYYCGRQEPLELPQEKKAIVQSALGYLPAQTQMENTLVLAALNFLDHGEFLPGLSTYVLLNKNVPRFQGGTITFFLHSLVPKFLKEERPQDPYSYFAEKADVEDDTGWGLTYIGDWFMNYGIVGVVFGLLLIVCLHLAAYRYSLTSLYGQFIYAGIIASLPLFLRSPLAYKTVGLTIALCLVIVTVTKKFYKRHPTPFKSHQTLFNS